jgi:lambda family phage portal protein
MNLLATIKTLFAKPKAMYEAGKRWANTGRRSIIHAHLRDARLDADRTSREEIARKARYFEANNAIVNRLADLFEQYTVGANGLTVIPSSSDETFNQAAAAEFSAWCARCDFNGQLSFQSMQSLLARAWFIDGEAFALKTSNMGAPAEPRLQLIETHRVSSPHDPRNTRVHDGVALDVFGRPIGFFVDTAIPGAVNAVHELKATKDLVHIWEPSRIGQLRGLSFLYPVLNDVHDLDDLGIYEMAAAKTAAEKTTIIKTESGELTPGQFEEMTRSKFTGEGINSQGQATTEQRQEFYSKAIPGRTVVAFHGDSVEEFVSQRPSVAVQNFWDHIIAKICVGVGMSKLLVFPHSMQGTVVRADLDVCDAWFRSRSSVMQGKVVEVYQWWLQWAVENVRTLRTPPPDFLRCTVRAPRSVKVDVGYDSAAVIAELKAGIRTMESICAPMGEDWRNVMRQSAAEAAFVKQLASDTGVAAYEIASKAYESAAQRAAAPTQQPRQLAT